MLLRHAVQASGQELFEKSVFTHVASIYADLLKQKKAFPKRKKGQLTCAQDCFGIPTWPPFHVFEHQLRPLDSRRRVRLLE